MQSDRYNTFFGLKCRAPRVTLLPLKGGGVPRYCKCLKLIKTLVRILIYMYYNSNLF